MKRVNQPADPTHGSGSLYLRGNIWWMKYLTPDGRRELVSTGSGDKAVAHRMLAERALETARAKVAALEMLVNGEAQEKTFAAGSGSGSEAGHRPEHAAGRKPLRDDAAQRAGGKRTGRKGGTV